MLLAILSTPAALHRPIVSRRNALGWAANGCAAVTATALPALADERPAAAPAAAGLLEAAQTYYINRQLIVAASPEREESLLTADFVICGEHHNSAADHRLETTLLRAMSDRATKDGVPLSLGLEMVERAFQPALDAYSAGKLTDDDLYRETQWATRWVWSWEQYLPLFQLAKARGIGLVALNTDTEVLRRVPIEGLESLDRAQRASLVPDPEGFVAVTREPYFGQYANRVIMASYGVHVQMQFMDRRATEAGFFSARILRDEAMASRAVDAVSAGAGAEARRRGRMLLLAGADHVKFELGIPTRLKRYAARAGRADARVETVLLSPTPDDTLSPSDVRLAVSLGAEEGTPALASYLIWPTSSAAPPRRDDAWVNLHDTRQQTILRRHAEPRIDL